MIPRQLMRDGQIVEERGEGHPFGPLPQIGLIAAVPVPSPEGLIARPPAERRARGK
jgi:hypothetical protein